MRRFWLFLIALSCAGLSFLPIQAADSPALPASQAIAPQTFPRTFTDGTGRSITLRAHPERIVSLTPAATEMLLDVSAAPQIAGVSRYDNIEKLPPAEQKRITRVGGILDPDYERIVALKPDLVILPQLADKTARARLESLGLTVIELHPESFQGVLDDIRLIGRASGQDAAAEKLAASIEHIQKLAATRLRDIPLAQRPRVLVRMGTVSPAPGAYIDELITASGGRNAVPKGAKSWVTLSTEEVLQLAPDVMVEIPESGETPPPPIALSATTRVIKLPPDDDFYHPGPRLGNALWKLAHALYPVQFPEALPPSN